MDDLQIKLELIEQLIEISKEAGKAILEVYNTNFDYQIKEDLSPLTQADTVSHNIICDRLKILTPDIPIISEENSDIPFNIRSLWKKYWLIDPLDGTKEFIKRNGEFTVNIALINDHRPIFGVIHVPVKDQTYWGSINNGSFIQNSSSLPKKINVSPYKKNQIRIVSSRSHRTEQLDLFLEKINDYEILNVGSSLKFCLIATGEANLYPRIGPTSEWDTAAGHAIVKFAGGHTQTFDGNNMQYNMKDSFINPYFIVSNSKYLNKEMALLIND